MRAEAAALFASITARYLRAGSPHPKSWVIVPAPEEQAAMDALVSEGVIEPRGLGDACVYRLTDAGAQAASAKASDLH